MVQRSFVLVLKMVQSVVQIGLLQIELLLNPTPQMLIVFDYLRVILQFLRLLGRLQI